MSIKNLKNFAIEETTVNAKLPILVQNNKSKLLKHQYSHKQFWTKQKYSTDV